jgi:GTP-binding protein
MVSAEEKDIEGSYRILLGELEQYNPELLVKDRVLAVTKTDLIDAKEKARIEKKLPKDIPTVMISSVSGEGLPALKDTLWKTLNK